MAKQPNCPDCGDSGYCDTCLSGQCDADHATLVAAQLDAAQKRIEELEAVIEGDKQFFLEAAKQQTELTEADALLRRLHVPPGTLTSRIQWLADKCKEHETANKAALEWMNDPSVIALVMGGMKASLIGEGTRYGLGLAADLVTKALAAALGTKANGNG